MRFSRNEFTRDVSILSYFSILILSCVHMLCVRVACVCIMCNVCVYFCRLVVKDKTATARIGHRLQLREFVSKESEIFQ